MATEKVATGTPPFWARLPDLPPTGMSTYSSMAKVAALPHLTRQSSCRTASPSGTLCCAMTSHTL